MSKYISLENNLYKGDLILDISKINDEIIQINRKIGTGADKNIVTVQTQYHNIIQEYLPEIYQDRLEGKTGRNNYRIKNYFNIDSLVNQIDIINNLITKKYLIDEKIIDGHDFFQNLKKIAEGQGLRTSVVIESDISNANNGIGFKNWDSNFKEIIKRSLFHNSSIKVYLFKIEDEICAFWELNQDKILDIEENIITNKNQDPFKYKDFHESSKDSGLILSKEIVLRFTASLSSKPFVILSGLSGSGKTKIAQSFVQWICENDTQYKIVPVGADWTNREPLVGYPNGLVAEEYITPDSGVIHLLMEAIKQGNENKPFFLILDEMNLSHVERYFADFLSIMESNDTIKLYTGNTRESLDKLKIPLEIGWPKNVFIIGTVNIDETTYMFSPKVLDRANVIEFRITDDEIESFLASPGIPDLQKLKGKGIAMAESFLSLTSQNNIVKNEDIVRELVSFFNQLKKVGAEFGYRSATEIMQLAAKLKMLEPSISDKDCLDIAIMQKLLPKLHGSRSKLVKILIAMSGLCVEGITREDFEKKFDDLYKNNFDGLSKKYPISFEKLIRMYKNVLANGFTSYAEA